MLIIPEKARRRVLSVVMDFIHVEDLEFNDNFPAKITHAYISLIEESGSPPEQRHFIRAANRIRTTFFKLNTKVTKKDFLENLLVELNQEIKPILEEIRKKKPTVVVPVGGPSCECVYIDDIDSFEKVKKVTPKDVNDLVPLDMSEANIKRSLADIIGEKFVPKDWGGEKSDLYSSQVVLRGKRISAAFLLKGPSVKKLTIAKCGTNGDQLLRLTKEPAQLFVVQHVGEIDTNVIEMLDTLVRDLSRKKKERFCYCIMDGVDTARVLKAYSKF